METRCFWPPESLLGECLRYSYMPTAFRLSSTRSQVSFVGTPGTPRQIFSQVERLQELRLDVPQVTLLAHELRKKGIGLPEGILTVEELADALAGSRSCPRGWSPPYSG